MRKLALLLALLAGPAVAQVGPGGGGSPVGPPYPYGGGSTSLTVGTTPITGGTTGYLLYVNGALLGQIQPNVATGVPLIFGSITPGDCLTWNASGISDAGGACNTTNATVSGPGSSVNTDLVTWNGVTGKIIADSGILAGNIVTGPASVTANGNLALFNGTTGKIIKDSTVLPGAGSLTPLATAPLSSGSYTKQNGTISNGDCLQWSTTSGVTDAGSACVNGSGFLSLTGGGTITGATTFNATTTFGSGYTSTHNGTTTYSGTSTTGFSSGASTTFNSGSTTTFASGSSLTVNTGGTWGAAQNFGAYTDTFGNNPIFSNCTSGYAITGGGASAISCTAYGTGVFTALTTFALNANSGGLVATNGTMTVGDCLKWSASGIQDNGAACVTSTLTNGTTPLSGFTSAYILYANGSVLGQYGINAASGVPLINGSMTAGDCLKWSASGIQDNGAACLSGANYLSLTSGGTVSGATSFTNTATFSGTASFTNTNGTAIYGDESGGSAASGVIGEIQTQDTTSASQVSLSTSGATYNIGGGGLSLTAGDWDCQITTVVYQFTNNETVYTWMSTSASSALPTNLETQGMAINSYVASTNLQYWTLTGGLWRFSLSASATIYQEVQSNQSNSNNKAYGYLRCRRVR